jgi:uncharacterized protein (DUF433 family)
MLIVMKKGRRPTGPAARGERGSARDSRVVARPSRRAEPTVSTTMRLRRSLRKRLEIWADRGQRSVSEVAHELLEEALRMRDCPGIFFASEPAGRTAKIAGTGLAVWEVLRDFVRDEDAQALRGAFPELSRSQLTAALLYFRRYPGDIRREVDANAALTPEALDHRYPGLIQVVAVE